MKARLRGMIASVLALFACASTPEPVDPAQASAHIGQRAQVCGVVASAKYASHASGEPTFLNLGEPFPRHVFTAVIWGADRHRFPYVPESLMGEQICVVGNVVEFRGKPEIVVKLPSQIIAARTRDR
jgi:micrococcal nuclease